MIGLPRPSIFAALLLAGCATGEPDELQQKLQQYYAAHAVEEDGACPSPEIGAVTRRKVLESDGERTRLRVRYTYFDRSRGSTPDWPQVLLASRACTGTAERDFTFQKTPLGQRVVAMSGPVRGE